MFVTSWDEKQMVTVHSQSYHTMRHCVFCSMLAYFINLSQCECHDYGEINNHIMMCSRRVVCIFINQGDW
jgi:hypothetical protein